MKKISNEGHVHGVVRKIYRDALELDWEHRSPREHTEQYQRWLADPRVGGVMAEWMAPDEQRVWIKDGPMKEFARALAGEGAYASFLSTHPRSPHEVVSRTMGAGWLPLEGSTDVKPLRCDANKAGETMRILWGPAKDFKHLLWAALEQWHAMPTRPLRVAVFDSVTKPLGDGERCRLGQIAERCRVPLSFIRL
jgi:hypothetical protein